MPKDKEEKSKNGKNGWDIAVESLSSLPRPFRSLEPEDGCLRIKDANDQTFLQTQWGMFKKVETV